MKELRVLAERWRIHYNTVRPHSSLGYTNNLAGTKDRAGQLQLATSMF